MWGCIREQKKVFSLTNVEHELQEMLDTAPGDMSGIRHATDKTYVLLGMGLITKFQMEALKTHLYLLSDDFCESVYVDAGDMEHELSRLEAMTAYRDGLVEWAEARLSLLSELGLVTTDRYNRISKHLSTIRKQDA